MGIGELCAGTHFTQHTNQILSMLHLIYVLQKVSAQTSNKTTSKNCLDNMIGQ